MAKTSKPRRYPLVLSMMGTVAATAAAVYYRRQIDEYNPSLITFEPHPNDLMAIKSGAALVKYWVDENGKHHYVVEDRKTEK